MVFERGGSKARARAAERDARGAANDGEPAGSLDEAPASGERMSFFESSYELHAGLEVVESSWSEALDMCPDSGWSALPPLPPPRNRQAR
jgi:hypothetical protein